MAKCIMVQGTMSNAGKSLIVAGLCRIFQQDGYRTAPFKSQNMALNSYITKDGLEIGRAQAVQAEAACIEPDVRMNPVLLKPSSDTGSQVIVNGKVLGNMKAVDYFQFKTKLWPDIRKAYDSLSEEVDIIVIEGAGSPAEINLKENDIVNMGLAEELDSPVLLVGDIDRGGVFAQLLGTLLLLEQAEKNRIKGFIINKFRGDLSLLQPGIQQLEKLGNKPVIGVVPYMSVDIEEEDSLSERFYSKRHNGLLDLAVIKFPKISNYTDFSPFECIPEISLRYVSKVSELGKPDCIFLPGTKNTIEDLIWLRGSGLEELILESASNGTIIFGICGGYQMLGMKISDPYGVETASHTTISGLGLLPVETILKKNKTRTQTTGRFLAITGPLENLSNLTFTGYEIHMGETSLSDKPLTGSDTSHAKKDGCMNNSVYGTYVHGIFDERTVCHSFLSALAQKKEISITKIISEDRQEYKQQQYNILAGILRSSLNMTEIYSLLDLPDNAGTIVSER